MTYGVNAAGGSVTGKKRHDLDFYRTPPEAIDALIKHYRDIIGNATIHDGSCGDRMIGDVAERHSIPSFNTDIVGRSKCLLEPYVNDMIADFLTIDANKYPCGEYITVQNPPFIHWIAFVNKCHELKMPFIAMFAKQNIWNAQVRLELYDRHPPKAIHPLTWRVDFTNKGNPTMDCCWCVWGENVPFSNEPLVRG